jgi:hypothetical protein
MQMKYLAHSLSQELFLGQILGLKIFRIITQIIKVEAILTTELAQ